MEQDISQSSQTVNTKIQDNFKGLLETLSDRLQQEKNLNTHSQSAQPLVCTSARKQSAHSSEPLSLSVIAATDLSSLSESSIDSSNMSINSVGYVADTSSTHPQGKIESPVKNPPCQPVTPLTPTTNLKMLVAAASSAFDREKEESETKKISTMDTDDTGTSRKMKSLALLCKKFLQVADEDIGSGKEFSLEMMASSLGINRRRIYDIINVMEALEMISKQSKNWYLWHGRGNLLNTLAKLKAMTIDDPDIKPYLEVSDQECNKENIVNEEVSFNERKHSHKLNVEAVNNSSECNKSSTCTTEEEEEDDDENTFCDSEFSLASRSVRYDKSLGVLCQKFVMLFLISPDNEVTLEEAGRVLVPDYNDDTLYMALNPPVNPKTKVRRLYDIANILTSLGLITKKVFIGPHHIKKPGYAWSGPTIPDIDAVCVTRKHEFGRSSTSKKGLVRKASFNTRPYLHQYEIQGNGSPSCSPVKSSGTCKFKRSLSFGGLSTSTPRNGSSVNTSGNNRQSTVVARPLCPKQVDYLREMREFENEMKKHSHRYPHVASIFHEFLQKYQSTLEQTAAANGRFILPKAVQSSHLSASIPQFTPPPSHESTESPTVLITTTSNPVLDSIPICTTVHPQIPSVVDYDSKSKLKGTDRMEGTHSLLQSSSVRNMNAHEHWDNGVLNQKQEALHNASISQIGGGIIQRSQLPVALVPPMYTVPPEHHSIPVSNSTSMLSPVESDNIVDFTPSTLTPVNLQSNNLVTNLANSILANIFSNIHNASTDMSLPQTGTPIPFSQVVPQSVSLPSPKPLSEIQNLQVKTSFGSMHKEGFIHVDELLVKPVGHKNKSGIGFLTPNTMHSSHYPVYGSLVSQRPIATPLECSTSCVTSGNILTTINPNAFLTSQPLTQSSDSHRIQEVMSCDVKSPKRPRLN